ncbi:MAG: C-GCAxxG-C-C family protein [Clostridia bacterium]|nr:C-GCAxxG-C-C family protein [Clostridia bacterium]
MKNHAELARNNFLKGYNCAQAVAIAFSEEMGMSETELAKLASSFGGGFGKMREVCGAVSGAMLVYGALRGNSDPEDGEAKKQHYAKVQDFAARFKAEHETIICRELLKNIALKKEGTSEPEERTPEYYRTRPCVRFVETASTILEQMLAE